MKLFICGLIIFCFTYIGKELSSLYFRRLRYFDDFKSILTFLKSNIAYNNKTIFELVQNYNFKSKNLKDNFSEYFNSEKNQINSIKLPAYLENNEKLLILDFFDNIGKKDKSETLNLLKSYIEIFDNFCNRLSKTEKQNSTLPLKLSISIGIALCILLL